MTVRFTKKEEKWIEKTLFNWRLKNGCPESIRKTAEPKLKILRGETYEYNGQRKRR